MIADFPRPVQHLGSVIMELLQEGFTHIQFPGISQDEKLLMQIVTVADFVRAALAAARDPDAGGLWTMTPVAQKIETYASLVELLPYAAAASVAESVETIKFLEDELKQDRFGSRAIRARAWATVGALMHYPPQDGEPAREGDEALRPDTVTDPVTGLSVNRGDAFVKSVELQLPAVEVAAAREEAGVDQQDFSALGFPLLHAPTAAGFGTTATIALVGALLIGTAALRALTLK